MARANFGVARASEFSTGRRFTQPSCASADTHHTTMSLARVSRPLPCPTPPSSPSNDAVLYVAMDEANPLEEARLRAKGVVVTTIRARNGHVVHYAGTHYELATRPGIVRFVDALANDHGLRSKTARAIVDILASQHENVRDELAGIAIVWARAEAGAAIPSRLVLSGCAADGAMHSDDGELAFSAVAGLAAVLPRAAKQVEDIHFAGDGSAEQVVQADVWRRVFPNLRTLWAYDDGTANATVEDLDLWAKITTGRQANIGRVTHAMTWSVRCHPNG